MALYELTEEQAKSLVEELHKLHDVSNVRTCVSHGWSVRFDIDWNGYTIKSEIHEPKEKKSFLEREPENPVGK